MARTVLYKLEHPQATGTVAEPTGDDFRFVLWKPGIRTLIPPGDVQLTYVLTAKEYRGRGLAEQAVRMAILNNQRPGRTIWYVTDTGNTASRNLCEKVGFGLAGYGVKSGFSLKMVE